MKIFISGPMTGIPDYNYPAFIRAKETLLKKWAEVLSPHEAPKSSTWEGYMRHDIKMLCECDAIAMLPGWKKSRGALLEKFIADQLGLSVVFMIEDESSVFLPMIFEG
jgi:hypothetical protein